MDIKNVIGPSSESSKIERNQDTKKAKSADKAYSAEKSSASSRTTSDMAEISATGRELLSLKLEAENYVDEVKNAKTLTDSEIEAIKEKISADYYFQPEVIDQVVEKLLQLSNFK